MFLKLNPEVYTFFESCADYLIIWIATFFLITIYRILLSFKNDRETMGYGMVISELPGLPLVLLHTVCFVKAIMLKDIASMLLFSWWGPGFLIVATIYIRAKKTGRKINWQPFGKATSYMCKINYLIFMAIYYYFDCPKMMYVFSIWIILDQINLAWFTNNADRTRRTFEDFWIFRVLYVALLFIPFFYPSIHYAIALKIFGISLFVLWLIMLYQLKKSEHFLKRPDNYAEFLRNIVYLTKEKK